DGIDALQEQLGFRNSDHLLHGLHEAMAAALGDSEHLFRFAAGEYVLTATAAGSDGKARADALRETVASTIFTASDHSQALTLSQAVCPLPAYGFDLDAVLRSARALARKLSGRGGDGVEVLPTDAEAIEPVVNDDAWKVRI